MRSDFSSKKYSKVAQNVSLAIGGLHEDKLLCDTLQAMAPTNIKTVHQTSLLPNESNSIDSDCSRLSTASFLNNKKSG